MRLIRSTRMLRSTLSMGVGETGTTTTKESGPPCISPTSRVMTATLSSFYIPFIVESIVVHEGLHCRDLGLEADTMS